MRAVKDQTDQIYTHKGKFLDYYQCTVLLLSAAAGCHTQFVSVSSRRTRKVYSTELWGSGFELDSPSKVIEDLDYDVDASEPTLLAKMTNRGNSKIDSYLPSEYYSSLNLKKIFIEKIHT